MYTERIPKEMNTNEHMKITTNVKTSRLKVLLLGNTGQVHKCNHLLPATQAHARLPKVWAGANGNSRIYVPKTSSSKHYYIKVMLQKAFLQGIQKHFLSEKVSEYFDINTFTCV